MAGREWLNSNGGMATANLLGTEEQNGTHSAVRGSRGARALGPHRRLPTGRAVLGGLLVTMAALGVLWAVGLDDSASRIEYLLVARDLEAGEIVGFDDFDIRALALPPEVDRFTLYRNSDSAENARWVVATPLRRGTLALVDDFEQIDAGTVPESDGWTVTVHLARNRALNGAVTSDLVVDVVGTFGEGESSETRIVARGAHVIQVAPTEGDGDRVAVRLEVADYQTVLDLVNAGEAGSLTLVDTARRMSPDEVDQSSFPLEEPIDPSRSDSGAPDGD